MKKSAEQMIDNIMDNFDFKKVHKTMNFLGWKWGENEVPSVEELKETASDLLNHVVDVLTEDPPSVHHTDRFLTSTGGFHASGYRTKRGNVAQLELYFAIDSWEETRKN